MKNLINKTILATLLAATIFSCTKEKITLTNNLKNHVNNIEYSIDKNDTPYVTGRIIDTPYVTNKLLDTPYVDVSMSIKLDTPYVGNKLVDTPYIKK